MAGAGTFFSEIINPRFNSVASLDISQGGKALVISDFHMGAGRRDDLARNGALLTELLEQYYYQDGWQVILNGDIEELQRFSLGDIQKQWPGLYRVFDKLAAEGRLYKALGNHDEDLIFEREYPYPLFNAIRIDTGVLPIFVYHGHQSSKVYRDYNTFIRLGLRYFLKPFGIRNISSARSPLRRFSVEKKAYDFSLKNNCISIIGHTHRALFESLGRFEFIKFEIERLCRDYPASRGEDRERIASEVRALRLELGKLKRSEKRSGLRQSLYGDELPVPCLFNSGSAIGRRGINAIELDMDQISLVYWFVQGEGRKFVNRGRYPVYILPGTKYCRTVLNQDRFEFVKARIELLGNSPEINAASFDGMSGDGGWD
ncbi:Ser/Thr protein phosphatase family protein [Treponema primitia ZAS-2]|uniref:Ser/Thr protein phosphatase family protein n=1 Tax=Treponema primitia (strain ATCC BAA-887 / DSM 12427 / ZAS-2) TaxID=545694 RepID=F5YNS7_TREPZ|nr:Ser/Thr phosphatase [Treponema primitia]AEF84251.1 Ser/Thr protein phosphatase family protein [Treponema primitia ZAS-2]